MKDSILLCIIVTLAAVAGLAQPPKEIRKSVGNSVQVVQLVEVPEATEDCAASECLWWGQLRIAANDLQRKRDEKTKRRYVSLFVEGLEKSHRIPLKDRPPQVLVQRGPMPFLTGVRPKNGKVELLAEFRSDGSIGEIKVVNSVRKDLDDNCIQALKGAIFLPAVKDNSFVTVWTPSECGYWSANGRN